MPFRSVLGIFLILNCPLGFAHKASDSYLSLKVSNNTIEGRWDIALRDLDFAINLDTDNNGVITWGELRSKRELIYSYALSHLQIKAIGTPTCQAIPTKFMVDNHTDGAYSVLFFQMACPQVQTNLEIDYSLFFGFDPQHRGLLRIDFQEATHTAVLSPDEHRQSIELAVMKPVVAFLQYLQEGIWHIWKGFDHILFLISLLLPSVFSRQEKHWHPALQLRPVLIEVTKIVTAFTIAHSITLSMAVMDKITLPSNWVESAIAASVILAALNNLYPVINKKRWLVAFVFGLVHGLGFANVLKDLGLPQELLILTLLAFNLGVEIGQMAIVSVFLPTAFMSRKSAVYQKVCFNLGSLMIAILAFIWFLERSLNLKLFT